MDKKIDKIRPIFDAVISLISEGTAIPEIKVSDISKKAGIGKGTIYEYFSTKEEVIVQSMMYFIRGEMEKLDLFLRDKMTFREKYDGVLDLLDRQHMNEVVLVSMFKLTHNSSDMVYPMKQAMLEEINKLEVMDHLLDSIIGSLRADVNVQPSMEDSQLYFIICSQLGAYMMSSKCNSKLLHQDKHLLRELAYNNIIKMVS